MDPLTHSATGLFLGRAGLNRFCGQAPWILLLAANAPDVDIVTLFGGQLAYLNYHRHLTHSLAAMPVLALLPVLAVRLFSGSPFRWLGAYAISLAAVASHLLLDFTNIYGIRLLLPFSARWLSLDITPVIDVWIWAVMALALTIPILTRLVNLEIGARTRNPGRGSAIFALLFVLVYNSGRAVLHARAVAMLDSRIYAGETPQRVAALPQPLNPLGWRAVVETQASFRIADLSLLEEFDLSQATVLYKPEPTPAITAANAGPVFRDFLHFAQFPLERATPLADPEDAVRVEAMDLRFGSPAQPAFVATAVVDKRQRVIRSWFSFGGARPR